MKAFGGLAVERDDGCESLDDLLKCLQESRRAGGGKNVGERWGVENGSVGWSHYAACGMRHANKKALDSAMVVTPLAVGGLRGPAVCRRLARGPSEKGRKTERPGHPSLTVHGQTTPHTARAPGRGQRDRLAARGQCVGHGVFESPRCAAAGQRQTSCGGV